MGEGGGRRLALVAGVLGFFDGLPLLVELFCLSKCLFSDGSSGGTSSKLRHFGT